MMDKLYCQTVFDGGSGRYAGKIISGLDKRSKIESRMLLNEVRTLRYLKHPNIVKYITHFQDGNKFIIMTEQCKNRDLGFLLKSRVHVTEDE